MDGACFHSNEEAVLSLSAVTETELLRAAGLVFVEVEQEIRLLISPQSSLTIPGKQQQRSQDIGLSSYSFMDAS